MEDVVGSGPEHHHREAGEQHLLDEVGGEEHEDRRGAEKERKDDG